MEKVLLVCLFALFNTQIIFGQSASEQKGAPVEASFLDKEPIFDFDCQQIDNPYMCFSVFIDENISLPDSTLDYIKNINGGRFPMNIVSFIIENDSSITDIKLFRGIGQTTDDYLLALENAITNSPKWIQGKKEGQAVRTKVSFPYTHKKYSNN